MANISYQQTRRSMQMSIDEDFGLPRKEIEGLRQAFKLFDCNGDGKISAEEIRKVMRSIGQEANEEDISMIISFTDGNESGTIEFDEFVRAMLRIGQTSIVDEPETSSSSNSDRKRVYDEQLRKVFRLFDQDNDGFLSRDEVFLTVKKLHLDVEFPEEVVNSMFDDADEDNDGRISLEEYIIAVRNSDMYHQSVADDSEREESNIEI